MPEPGRTARRVESHAAGPSPRMRSSRQTARMRQPPCRRSPTAAPPPRQKRRSCPQLRQCTPQASCRELSLWEKRSDLFSQFRAVVKDQSLRWFHPRQNWLVLYHQTDVPARGGSTLGDSPVFLGERAVPKRGLTSPAERLCAWRGSDRAVYEGYTYKY